METFIHNKLQFLLSLHNILSSQYVKTSFLLALSGGQDSLCLLKIMFDLSKQYKFRLSVVYFDHRWRLDSVLNGYHLIHLIQQYGLLTYIYQVRSCGLDENMARIFRYQILLKIALEYKYQYIVTGHTRTDQAETIFNHLIRGTTLDGLHSLSPIRKIQSNIYLLRPLLYLSNTEVAWFCRYCHLPIWLDLSNCFFVNDRNRIRYELIPYLRQFFKRNVDKNLCEFVQSTVLDHEYIRQNTIKLYQKIRHKDYMAINYVELNKQHKALQFRLLHLFIRHSLNSVISYPVILKIFNLLQADTYYYDYLITELSSFSLYFSYPWLYIAD